jgi:two-component system chemotaxis sensor kinase CheA
MNDDEAVRLIFRPGFSTATTITDVSGRGVGLDIVQNNIEKLGGSVTVYSEPGIGTRFVLRLPLTLAIIKALLIESGNNTYALPLGAVNQITRVDKNLIQTVEGLPLIRFQNDFIPLVRLDKALGMVQNKSNNGSPQRNGNHNGKGEYENMFMAVVRFGQWQAGLIVDKFLGEQEVVIKPLGSFVGEIPGIAGAMIQSDGRIALIVDIPSLLQSLVNSNRNIVRATLKDSL